jgi:hypothetical protein
MSHEERPAPRPPAQPDRPVEDALSPAKELRERARASRSERLGDSSPIGPETTPPLDAEGTPEP